MTDLEIAHLKFDVEVGRAIAKGHRRVVLRHGAFDISLGANAVNLQEGYWSIALHTSAGVQLVNLSFGFMSCRSVLMASIQGTASTSQDDTASNAIHDLTKAAHGLRPAHLLLAAFQLLCSSWGVDEIVGIDPRNHIKGRWNQRRSRLKFDYRAAWQEAGAIVRQDGNWDLPPLPRRRTQENTPTRKRSLYRKRYLMLDDLTSQLAGQSVNG